MSSGDPAVDHSGRLRPQAATTAFLLVMPRRPFETDVDKIGKLYPVKVRDITSKISGTGFAAGEP